MLIKKYPNRRLYDVANSRYITLGELALLLQEHDEVKVIDAKTEEDITQTTLLQVLLEQQQKGLNALILPHNFLLQLIRMQNDACNKAFAHYISLVTDLFAQNSSYLDSITRNPISNYWQKLFLDGIGSHIHSSQKKN